MPKKQRPNIYELSRASRCHNCDIKLEVGQLVSLKNAEDDREALCKKCAGLEQYTVVPSGNAALTRLASKHSDPCYSVVRWSELWKCYERKGILVTNEALEKARKEIG